jgi:hypothetical protein
MALRSRVALTLVLACLGVALAACGPSNDIAKATPTPTPTPTVTPPTAQAIATAPTTLRVTCAPRGTKVSSKVVTTSPTGVRLAVVATVARPRVLGYRITPKSGAPDQLGLIQPTRRPQVELYPLSPGRMDLRCGRSANSGLDTPVTVFIVDRNGYYVDVDVVATLGCTPRTLKTPRDYIDRATASEALTLLNDQLPSGTYTSKAGPGYKAASIRKYLLFKNGKGYGIATVATLPNYAFHPSIIALC